MRIAYVCHYDAFRHDGVVRKIGDQVAQWRARGHRVEILCLSPPAAGRAPTLAARIFPFSGHRQRVGATLRLQRAVRAFVPDCVYVRADLYLPPLGRMLRSTVSVIEVNSDLTEYAARERSRMALPYARFSGWVMARNAAGFVYVNNDIARAPTLRALRARGTPQVVIANGGTVPPGGPFPAPRNERAAIVLLVGTSVSWQGLDKLLWLARQMPEADFHVVGPTGPELAQAPAANVSVHGTLPASGCEAILARCDVAVGTLALHRKNLSEASPLKVREYLLAGLPVIIGYEDTDFLDERPPYILRIANTESNVRDQLEQIRGFVQWSRGRRAPARELEARLGVAAKEITRLRFFEQLVAARAAAQPARGRRRSPERARRAAAP